MNKNQPLCRNPRLTAALNEKYDGRTQMIYSGNIDDYFLLFNADGQDAAFYNLKNILLKYADFTGYDMILSINKKFEISFYTPQMGSRFAELVSESSRELVPENMRRNIHTFQPQARQNSAQPIRNESAENARNQVRQTETQNTLDQITKVLRCKDLKVFVVFENPERLLDISEGVNRCMETIASDWRDLSDRAHPATKTALLVNPARKDEFVTMLSRNSQLKHMVMEIDIPQAGRDEYMGFLKENYLRKNHLPWNKSTLEQVVSTGISQGNLFNFVKWIQEFFVSGSKKHLADILISSNNDHVGSLETLVKKLNNMIGLENVKTVVRDMLELARQDRDAFCDSNYTMLFLGNPGTGKTEIARLIAKMFFAMGLRRKPTVKQITVQSIQSAYNSGDVTVNLKNAVNEAAGGVLFIDEVYQFAEDKWARNAFDSILAAIYDMRKDLTVIMAGYEEKLPQIMDINPGFDSRIPERFRIRFPDYSAEEKVRIFKFFMKEKNPLLKLEKEAEEKLQRILLTTHGNARGVQNVFEQVLASLKGSTVITEEHIHDPSKLDDNFVNDFLTELDNNFIGMVPLKEQLRKYLYRTMSNIQHEKKTAKKMHSAAPRIYFTGAPGTGKTTIARLMAKAFKALGIIDSSDVHEIAAASLKGSHIGEAQENVRKMFKEHRGKLLFLDEIYSLFNPNIEQNDSYGQEAVDTLVQCLTFPENDRTALIIAGYKEQVDEFMELANPGLKSRIRTEIHFPNYTARECCDIFFKYAKNDEWAVSDKEKCQQILLKIFRSMTAEADFANARSVRNIFEQVLDNMSCRCYANGNAVSELGDSIIPDDLLAICQERNIIFENGESTNEL